MAITFNVIQKNPDKTIVLEEKNTSKPQMQPKRYVLPEENVDKFQKARKGNVTINKMNQIFTPLLALAMGITTSNQIKSLIGGSLAGIAVAAGSLFGLMKFDKMIQTQSEKNLYKKFDVKEVEQTPTPETKPN